jgi:hypothetical protein
LGPLRTEGILRAKARLSWVDEPKAKPLGHLIVQRAFGFVRWAGARWGFDLFSNERRAKAVTSQR